LNLSSQQFAFASYQWGYITAAAVPTGALVTDKFYSENGFLAPMSYQSTANPTGGDPGTTYSVDPVHGPQNIIASLIAVGYKGVISERDAGGLGGVATIGSYTRYVTKFSLTTMGLLDFNFFIGLIGATGATVQNVGNATIVGAPPADLVQVGLRVDTSVDTNFYFDGLGAGGRLSVPTGIVSVDTGVYHFVMETRPGSEVYFGLFDSNFQLIVQDSILNAANLPLDSTSLYVVHGVRKVAGANRINLTTWFTHVVARYDLSGPGLLGP
jgi:hypothetical protein